MPHASLEARRASAAKYREKKRLDPTWRAARASETRTRSAEKRAAIASYKAAKGCRECGEVDPVVLDAHHRDPSTKHHSLKSRSAARKLWSLGWDTLMAELEKCDVLCANCHRREHASES